jgi:hypothetical protein
MEWLIQVGKSHKTGIYDYGINCIIIQQLYGEN